MNTNNIQKIANSLQKISTKVTAPKIFPFQIHDGVSYSIPNEAALQFSNNINTILCHKNFIIKFSSKYIEKQLKIIFAELLKNDKFEIEAELLRLIESLNEFNEFTEVFIRLDGIKLDFCLLLGRVKLCMGDANIQNYIEMKAWNIIKETKHTDDEKIAIMNQISSTIKEDFDGGCVAIVNAEAEPIRAREIAKEEVYRVIDLLRYAIRAWFPIDEDIRIGLKGDFPKSKRQVYAISESSFSPDTDHIGSVRSLKIDLDVLSKMESIGVFTLSKALKKKQATNFEKCILRGVHWFSVSQTQNEKCNSFLFLIVSLESLFKPPSGSSISSTVAESVALLLADKLEQRKNIIKFIRDSYGKRSSVAHGGNKDIKDNDFYNLLGIVGAVLMICVKNNSKFETQNDLMDSIEEMKLS